MEKRALTDTEKLMLLKFLVGGAAAGGAAGLATSYGNQIKSLKDDADKAVDDPVIEIPSTYGLKQANIDENPSKHVDKSPGITALSLSLPAIGIPALLSYAAARRAYQQNKKKELEIELANSEEAYSEALAKSAGDMTNPNGRPYLTREMWGALAGGVVPLSGLAAAFMTNKILDKSFPIAKPAKRQQRIRIRRQPVEQEIEDANDSETAEEPAAQDATQENEVQDETLEKEAFYELEHSDAVEFLVRTVLGNEKTAAVSQLPDLLLNGSVDYQRTANTFMFRGPDAGFAHVKSASRRSWADELDRAAGIHLMTKSAALGPAVALLTAAEFADSHPMLCSQARAIDPRVGEQLVKFAALMGATSRVVDVEQYLGEEGTGDFQKAAASVDVNVSLAMLSQICMEKRSFVQAPAKINPTTATIAGALGGLGGPVPAALASGIHSGVSSDSVGSALGSGLASGGGSLAGAVAGGLLVRHLLSKTEVGRGFDASDLAPLGGGIIGSAIGGALGSRWAAGKHNSKQEEQDERQMAVLQSLNSGNAKTASGDVPTHDAINITVSRSSQAAETENSKGDDPIEEATEQGDIVDEAMNDLAGVAK